MGPRRSIGNVGFKRFVRMRRLDQLAAMDKDDDNVGFKRFVRMRRGAVSLDREAVARDARLDGKFVLRTSTDLDNAEVARAYKSLWRVERAFREWLSLPTPQRPGWRRVRRLHRRRCASAFGAHSRR